MLAKTSITALRRYRITFVVWIAIVLFGGWSYFDLLDREGFPPVEIPAVVVSGTYFVDDADTVDEEAAEPISDAVGDIDDVVNVQSTARADDFTVFVEFSQDTGAEDGASEVRRVLDDEYDAPQEANYEIEALSATQFNNQYDLLASVYMSKDVDASQLESWARDLAETIEQAPEVRSSAAIALTTDFEDPFSGEIEQRQTSFSRAAVSENSTMGFTDSALVGVTAASEVDDLDLDEAVQSQITQWNQEQADADEAVEATVSAGFADIIRNQITELQTSIGIGLLAVLLVAGLLIGWRSALIVAIFIPTVMATTLLGIYVLGYSLNVIVLFVLVLTLGLIVDNATVVTEALDVTRQRRQKVASKIKTAISRVGTAMIAGTLTTVLVFAPLLFVGGVLGEFIQALPATVITALLSSLVIAIVIVPFLAAVLLLRRHRGGGWLQRPIRRVQQVMAGLPMLLRTRPRVGRAVAAGMVVLSVGAVVGAGWMGSQLAFDIFPESDDADAIILNIDFANDQDIEEVTDLVDTLNEDVKDVLEGDLSGGAYYEANTRSAFAQLDLIPFSQRETTSQEYVRRLDEQLNDTAGDDAEILVRQLDAGPPPDDFPFTAQVFGDDIDAMVELVDDIDEAVTTENITRADGGEVRIDTTETNTDPGVVRRQDGERLVSLSVRFDDENTSAAIAATEDFLDSQFPASELEDRGLDGEALRYDLGLEEDNVESFEDAQLALGVALVLMYILLILQFNSFLQPLLVFTAIPLSLFGVVSGLLITGNPLSFFVVVGLTGLFGVVVNNAILLLDYANQERANGYERIEAISRAVEQRFRPVVTTTLTTVVALTPLMLTDPFWEPLAATVVFGLISSTVLILLVFPYFYLVIERFRDWKNHKFPYLR